MKFLLLLLVSGSIFAGLPEVRNEPNLVKRARLALDNADVSLNAARTAYGVADLKKTGEALEEMRESLAVSQAALTETGKDARKRSGPFKYGEVRTRDMLKRLAGLENAMDIDDRKLLEPARIKLQEVHDAWLLGIMGEK